MFVFVSSFSWNCWGCNYPCQMSLALKWFPAQERTTLWTLLGAGEAAGTILAMSTSAQIATSIGWSCIFFLSGALGLCFVLIFYIFASKDPESHLHSIEGTDMIVETRLKKLSPFNKKVPWYNIITYGPFLATCCTHFAYNYQAYLALSLGPYFFKARYNVDISDPSSTLGVFACLPYVVSLFTGPLAGVIADELVKREIVTSWTGSRKIMNSAGMLSCAIFYGALALPFIQNNGLALGVTMLTCGISLGILAPAGYWANYQDLSSTYGSVLCGLGNTIATVPGCWEIWYLDTSSVTARRTTTTIHMTVTEHLLNGVLCLVYPRNLSDRCFNIRIVCQCGTVIFRSERRTQW